jgi:hypothetical protein
MRNIVLLFSLIFLIQTNSVCQSLPDSSATWTIASIGWGTYFANETFRIEGDTTINSIRYKSIYSTKDSIYNPLISTYFCAVRELNNKWFFVPADSTKEFMLYNFDVEIGDTVFIDNPWWYGRGELIVFDIDSLELSGSYYKYIGLGYYHSSGQPLLSDHCIAGIGSTQGFYLSGLRMMDAGFELLCFHRNDTLIYLNSPSGTCGYISTTDVKINSLISDVTLSPNPVFDKLTVISKLDFQVEIYDISGKK